MNPTLYHLNLLTGCVIERARQKAKEGKKDEARDWYRFIFQANIIGVLEAGGWKVELLRDHLKLLGDECNPNTQNCLKGELERIADSLDVIKNFIMRSPALRGDRLTLAGLQN